jgi:hypothetical protein
MEEDPNAPLIILPFLDYLNHSFEPNCVVVPDHDRVNNNSYVMLRSLRDIQKGE